MSKDTVTLKLTATVEYVAGGASPEWLANRLKKQLEAVLDDEMISTETPADIIGSSITVVEVTD